MPSALRKHASILLFVLLLLVLVPRGSMWGQTEPPELAFTHVTVVNPSETSAHANTTVLIKEGRIVEVGSSTSVKIPRGATVVNASGKFLIPSLWDMHVHTENAERDFPMFVANGVLGVRNMAGVAKDVFRWREETASGKMLGPQIVAAGPLIDGPEPAHPEHAIPVHDTAEAIQAVHSLKTMGADFIKVYDGVPRDAYFAIADESKKVGLPFVGHLPRSVRVVEASNAGQRSLEHGAYLAGGSTYEEDAIKQEASGPNVMEEAQRTGNFSLIPEDIAKKGNELLDHLSSERLAQLYRTFAKNGTYLTPTLVVRHARVYVDDISKTPDPRNRYMTRAELEAWKPENDMFSKYRTSSYIAYQKREYNETLKGIKLAQQLGVQLLAGTDVVAPWTWIISDIFSAEKIARKLAAWVISKGTSFWEQFSNNPEILRILSGEGKEFRRYGIPRLRAERAVALTFLLYGKEAARKLAEEKVLVLPGDQPAEFKDWMQRALA